VTILDTEALLLHFKSFDSLCPLAYTVTWIRCTCDRLRRVNFSWNWTHL